MAVDRTCISCRHGVDFMVAMVSQQSTLIMSIQGRTGVAMNSPTASQPADDAMLSNETSLTSPSSVEASLSPKAVMFPNNLFIYRKRANLKQTEASIAIHVPRNRLSMWENGQQLPSFLEAKRLADLYGVAIADLYPRRLEQELVASV